MEHVEVQLVRQSFINALRMGGLQIREEIRGKDLDGDYIQYRVFEHLVPLLELHCRVYQKEKQILEQAIQGVLIFA